MQRDFDRLRQQVIALSRFGFDQVVIAIGQPAGEVSGTRDRCINDAICASCQVLLNKNPSLIFVKTNLFSIITGYYRCFFCLGFTVQVKHNAGQRCHLIFLSLYNLNAKAVHNSAVLNGVLAGIIGGTIALNLISVLECCLVRVAVAADHSTIHYNGIVGDSYRASGTTLYRFALVKGKRKSAISTRPHCIICVLYKRCVRSFVGSLNLNNLNSIHLIVQIRRRIGNGKGREFCNVLRNFNSNFVRNSIADAVLGIILPASAILDFFRHVRAASTISNCTIRIHCKNMISLVKNIAFICCRTTIYIGILVNAVFTLRQTRELNLSISIRYKLKGFGRILLACDHFRPIGGIISLASVLLQNKFYTLQ